jgi:hypothetical protein
MEEVQIMNFHDHTRYMNHEMGRVYEYISRKPRWKELQPYIMQWTKANPPQLPRDGNPMTAEEAICYLEQAYQAVCQSAHQVDAQRRANDRWLAIKVGYAILLTGFVLLMGLLCLAEVVSAQTVYEVIGGGIAVFILRLAKGEQARAAKAPQPITVARRAQRSVSIALTGACMLVIGLTIMTLLTVPEIVPPAAVGPVVFISLVVWLLLQRRSGVGRDVVQHH